MFPIDSTLPDLLATLEAHNTALLVAPPGAGKTTRVPPALLAAGWAAGGKIVMLEPRRLAARSAARYMARELGESVGQTVGYRTRLDTRVSARTRIEVVTEGILTRMIQSDPALEGIACVIFDEFHERSLQADLGLALVREAQQVLRPDLKLVVMSATLAIEPLKKLLDDPPLLASEGRSFPVDIHYRPAPRERRLIEHVAATISQALDEQTARCWSSCPAWAKSAAWPSAWPGVCRKASCSARFMATCRQLPRTPRSRRRRPVNARWCWPPRLPNPA
jgi:ATP-dependent helicase HrpB